MSSYGMYDSVTDLRAVLMMEILSSPLVAVMAVTAAVVNCMWPIDVLVVADVCLNVCDAAVLAW